MRIFSDPACLGDRVPPGYPERPERLAAILERLAADGWTIEPPGEPEGVAAAIEAIHETGYVERFRRAVERGDGLLDSSDNPLSAGTWDAAWAAVRCGLAAADAIAGGGDPRAFAAVRPPGHHAERATAMGFCFFNTVAIAAQRLLSRHRLERVAIVDFDVHHGNATQHQFEERPDVFFASLHRYPFYPGTGAPSERGRGAGLGTTLNVALAAGTDDATFEAALRDTVLPAVAAFAPAALLVSAGFDAWRGDPVGGLRITAPAFGRWGGLFRRLADEVCGGRLLSVLEGGYDLAALPDLVARYLAGVEGRETGPGRPCPGTIDCGE